MTVRNVLVLNASYEPLSVVSARRATCLVLADKAEVIEATQAGPLVAQHLALVDG